MFAFVRKNRAPLSAVALALVSVLLTMVLLTPRASVDAASVVGYQTVEVEDGSTVYTQTSYTGGYLAGAFGVVQIQAYAVVSGTGYFTATPQFSNEPVACSSVDATTGWFDAVSYVADTTTTSGTTTVTEGSITPQLVLSATVAGREVDVLGRCLRLKMEGASYFTPTIYVRMVNAND
jgi:hypothetical protein